MLNMEREDQSGGEEDNSPEGEHSLRRVPGPSRVLQYSTSGRRSELTLMCSGWISHHFSTPIRGDSGERGAEQRL